MVVTPKTTTRATVSKIACRNRPISATEVVFFSAILLHFFLMGFIGSHSKTCELCVIGVQGVGQSGYSGTTGAPAYGSGGSYSGGSYGGGGGDDGGTTTPDPLNDGFSFYKGIPIYQTYYEKYLLQKAQATTVAPSAK